MKKFFAIVALFSFVGITAASGIAQKSPSVNTGIATSFEIKHFVGERNNVADFHVSEEVTPQEIWFGNRLYNWENQSEMVRQLFQIKGITTVQLNPYNIRIRKADVFTWNELRPQIEKVLVKNITPTPAKRK